MLCTKGMKTLSGKNQGTSNKATFGIYRTKTEINKAINLLNTSGFSRERMSMLYPDHIGDQDFAQVQKSEALKYAKLGGAGGVIIAAAVASLITVGVFGGKTGFFGEMTQFSTGFKVFLFLGAAFIGLSFGTAAGAMIGIGTPKRAGRRHGQYVHAGGILLSFRSMNDAETNRVENLFEKSGAQDIASIDEDEGWSDVFSERDRLESHP